jgi:hypothetical protein
MSADTTANKSKETPKGAQPREKLREEDDAVRDAVTTERETEEKGTKSVLPGPPIPPSVQQQLREKEQTSGKK